MSWENDLYLSIIGIGSTAMAISIVVHLGLRYRRDLPKRSIIRSIESLVQEREQEEARLAEVQDDWRIAQDDLQEADRQRQFLEEAEPAIKGLQEEIQKVG